MVDKQGKIKNDRAMRHSDITEHSQKKTPDHSPHRVTLDFGADLTGERAQEIGDALENFCLSVLLHNKEATDGDAWTVTLMTLGPPDMAALEGRFAELKIKPVVHTEKLPPTDWLQHVHDHFPPVTVGSFFIYGSHYNGDVPSNLTPLRIDAATAFGSGEHETTSGCLQALEKLKKQGLSFRNALDMGCGSGILAIAITKLWPDAKAVAIDIDPESINVTRRHTEMNGAGHIETEAGDGYNAKLARAKAPYDLVVCNILAGPLVEMAPDLDDCLAKGGHVVLSGLLARQEQEVVSAHKEQGLQYLGHIALGDWRVLILTKTA